MSNHSILFVGSNTSIIEVRGLADHEGNLVLDATVECTDIRERDTGLSVAGVPTPITLNHVGEGLYQASLLGTPFDAGRWYVAIIHAVTPVEQLEGEFFEHVRAVERRA
jgi:hypothetical protein